MNPLIRLAGFTTALVAIVFTIAAPKAKAADTAPSFTFASIDGGTYDTAKWRGKPVLVVNTASMCGYTPQYADLQALSDHYGDKAVVLAVPSDDFSQELGSDAEVKEFCELNYALTLPMTTIAHVATGKVDPFYAWVAKTEGFKPGWNFNKVLIGPDGRFVKAWGSNAKPMGAIKDKIDAVLAAGKS
ncbi:glutathione peroxidase [Cypionkella aquatica]|uniref:Glutathione peroxidase n=1 Tax=Cypionkella aquatica TaxID=1756042 RepID=A0AA37TZU8_9RHOB|nr:glutathione peroxidase [Cypionkella aquatica]GLS85225.1 glutathione peroxidase [Cypionkella aquatica]